MLALRHVARLLDVTSIHHIAALCRINLVTDNNKKLSSINTNNGASALIESFVFAEEDGLKSTVRQANSAKIIEMVRADEFEVLVERSVAYIK